MTDVSDVGIVFESYQSFTLGQIGVAILLDVESYHATHLFDEQLQAKENGHGDGVAIEFLCRHGELDAALARAVGQTRTEARQVCWQQARGPTSEVISFESRDILYMYVCIVCFLCSVCDLFEYDKLVDRGANTSSPSTFKTT